MPDDPVIFDLAGDPEKAPRTSAIILVLCGLLGVGFLVVNVAFTGEDPYLDLNRDWDEEPIQGPGNIVPNVWRGKNAVTEEDDGVDPDGTPKLKSARAKAGAATQPGVSTPYGTVPAPVPPPGSPHPYGKPTTQPARR